MRLHPIDSCRPALRARPRAAIEVIELAGEIDGSMMLELSALIGSLIDQHRVDIVLNFSRVEHVHYRGIDLLMERSRQLRSLGGDLKLVGMSRYLLDIFRAVDADGFFDRYESLDVAVGHPIAVTAHPEAPSP